MKCIECTEHERYLLVISAVFPRALALVHLFVCLFVFLFHYDLTRMQAGLPEAGHPHPESFFNEGKRPSCRRTNNTELKMDGGARKEARCRKQNASKEVGKRLTALNYGAQKGGGIHLHHLRTFKGAVIF